MADQDAPRAIADRAQLRAPTLADRFGLDRPTMPHPTTWDRVSGAAIDPQRFARLVADFLASAAASARRGKRKRRGAVALCLDGETLRGTIPAGLTRGVHLLAAYLPAEGIVLIEVAVDGKENEIVTAREVLSRIDVHGCVVTGDAMSTQRKLSRQIRRNGGDYLRCVKEDRGRPHDDIAAPFALRAAAAPTAHDTPPLHALHDATG